MYLSYKSGRDFPKLVVFAIVVALFYSFSCPIQHVPAELGSSAGVISKA